MVDRTRKDRDEARVKMSQKTQKYEVNQYTIETLLAWVNSKEIAIPEIQRPFVWDSTKVRDLIDSLYQGFPIGYIIAWRAPNIRLKDGKLSDGKKILIDGQQRITALTAAILGQEVVTKDYKKTKIKISFNPSQDRFEVLNPAIQKDHTWFPDIAPIVTGQVNIFKVVEDYCLANPGFDRALIGEKVDHLRRILSRQIGLIELDSILDIETVTEVFIRINSKGVVLSQADFAMSKIASNENYNGSLMRKCIDYFCHLAVAPEFFQSIAESDKEFIKTEYFSKIKWLKDERESLYDPSYTDLLRVAFTSEFGRGKLSDLVSLLSGRNFETRTYEEEIARISFERLNNGIISFINETNYKRFIMLIKSAGFISEDLIRSQNTLNFAYIAYLKLRSINYDASLTENFIRRWFVMSILTGRYSNSPESEFDTDIRMLSDRDPMEVLKVIEKGQLSDAFWEVSLVQELDTSVSNSPYFLVFQAAQIKANDKGFLSKEIGVQELVLHRGDVHHLFPKELLKKSGKKRSEYNQVANFVLTQQEINIKIGKKSPKDYMSKVYSQCNGEKLVYGSIADKKLLLGNLEENCIPENFEDFTEERYDKFLEERRRLMANKIKKYYGSL